MSSSEMVCWVRDRLPTQEHADENGMVATKAGPQAWDSIVWREDEHEESGRRASSAWISLRLGPLLEAVGSDDSALRGKKKKKKGSHLKEKEKEVAALVVKLMEAAKGIETLRSLVKDLVARLDVSTKEIKQRDHQLTEALKLIDSFQDAKFLHKEEIRKRDNQIAESLVLIDDCQAEKDASKRRLAEAVEDYRLVCVEAEETVVLLGEANKTIDACRNQGFLSWLFGRSPGCGT